MALPSDMISFGEWLPDLPALNNPGMVLVQNALPTATSYTSVNAPEYRGDALGDRVLHAHWCIAGGGEATAVFAATEDTLYRQSGSGSWDDVSKSGGYTASKTRWDMAAFGSRLIAVSIDEATQYYDVDGSDANTVFADLPNAPSASTVGLIRDFVVLGDVDDLGENYIQWSGFNNSEAWTSSRTTQSDNQPLASNGGKVQTVVSGSEGYIFLENSVYRMSYVGPPTIFRLDEIAPGRGTPSPKSVVRLGPLIFYYDTAGFYQFDARSNQFRAIGHNKVDRWFRRNTPESCLFDMQASVDPVNKIIVWAFCQDDSSTLYTHLLAYHYELKRWALLLVDVDAISFLPTPSASLDDLSTILSPGDDTDGNAILGNIDEHSISVDSNLYSGGGLVFSVFGANHKLGTLSGDDVLEAAFVTAEAGAKMNNRILTNRQRPFISFEHGVTSGQVRVSHRDNLSDRQRTTAPSSLDQRGQTYVKIKSRFQQYHLNVAAGFEDVLGLEVFRRVE